MSTSSTGFFLSSATPTSLDLAVFAHLSLLVFPPWPQPLAGELLRARFPDLVTHTCLIRDLLWSPRQKSKSVPLPPIVPAPQQNALVATVDSLIPFWPPDWLHLPWSDPTPKDAKEDAVVSPEQHRAFIANRWVFVAGVTAFGLYAGWGKGLFRPSEPGERAEE